MSVFESVKISWGDSEYEIPADRVLGAIARIEQVVTLPEIHSMAQRGGAFQLTRISAAYASVLRYACTDPNDPVSKITTEDVYAGMFVGAGGSTSQAVIMAAVTGLMSMMVPPSPTSAEVTQGNE